ncbi:haloacid dehalogenase, type II [Burkholderia humptydooensis MSMB43]|uniref:Haloacid dehalogenase, type II n=1 Tax=Burkholderia humptydooensis MSMB43 TaxID=441157 RepID=A0ABN0G1C8_9BURK|nr:haloacid dehalogenase, type II [Burkholderia humptydooensis MSMB43]
MSSGRCAFLPDVQERRPAFGGPCGAVLRSSYARASPAGEPFAAVPADCARMATGPVRAADGPAAS